MLRRVLAAPWRFLVWLTTDTGRRRPGFGETMDHMKPSALGTGVQRQLVRTAEAERERVDRIKQHQKAATGRPD
jgi:hypothetical protein